MTWDPDQYLAFADERALPFHHLVAAVEHLCPRRVLDVGCGPGALTASLLQRWPNATIHGIDSSPEMIEHARRREIPGRLSFELADFTGWSQKKPFDLVLSNACLHWIEDHADLLDRIVELLADDGVLAFQVPANFDRPSHSILAELCRSEPWNENLGDAIRVHVRSPEWYLTNLERRGLRPTVWQTTYFHNLTGEDPVLEWVKGTALRAILARLPDDRTETFLKEYATRLREAYPAENGLTIFPFNRTFAVAERG